jgi:hypothetical protein
MKGHVPSGSSAVSVALALVTIATAPTSATFLPEAIRSTRAQPTAEDRPGEWLPCGHPVDTDRLELDVVVVETGGADPLSLQQAGLEVTTIWSAAGVRVFWSMGPGFQLDSSRVHVPVVVRPVLRRAGEMIRRSGHKGRPLGWVKLDGAGRPHGPLEISLAPISESVLSGMSLGRRLVDLPLGQQQYAVGRAIGRVIAHELGHWLFGRGHTKDGLMAPSLDTRALTVTQAPRLPREWSRAARRAACQRRSDS